MILDFFKRAIAYYNKEEVVQRRPRGRRYEMTIVRFNPAPEQVTETLFSSDAASAGVDACTDSDCIIAISAWHGNFSLGDFDLWCSGEYSFARICEHREHEASNPDGACVVNHPVSFKDDDGSLFTLPPEEVLARELAVRAMHAWLIECERPSFLRWS